MKWVAVALAAIVTLAIAALVVVPYVVDTPRIQALIASSVSQAIGRPVHFRGLSVRALPLPAVELQDLEVADDPRFARAPFLKLEKGTLRLSLRALLAGRVEFTQIALTRPTIALVQDAQRRWNIASLGTGSEAHPAPSRPGRGGPGGAGQASAPGAGLILGSRLRIEEGFVSYETRSGTASKYRVEDLDLTISGHGSRIEVEGDARVKPGDLHVKISRGVLTPAGPRAGLFDAAVRATVALEGKDLSGLAAAVRGPSSAITGAVKGTLAVTGTLGAPKAEGGMELSDLKITETRASCPPPRKRTLSVPSVKLDVRWQEGRLTAHPLAIALDRGTITTNLVATVDGPVHVDMSDLAVTTLPLDKVLVDFLCQGYAVTGPLDLAGTLSLNAVDPWKTLEGTGHLKIGAGRVVGSQALAMLAGVVRAGGAVSSLLAADVPSSLFGSPLEYDSITATYRITGGVVTTRDLLYTSRAMTIGVRGQYALTTGAMDLDVVVHHGRGQVAAKVTGTSAAPSVRVVPPSVLRDLDADKVQRGLQDLLKRFR